MECRVLDESTTELVVARIDGDFTTVSDAWKCWLEIGQALRQHGADRALVLRGPGRLPATTDMLDIVYNLVGLGLEHTRIAFVIESGMYDPNRYAGLGQIAAAHRVYFQAFATREDGMRFLER